MKTRLVSILLPLMLLPLMTGALPWSAASDAAVVVVANRTESDVVFSISPPEGKGQDYELASGDVLPVPVSGSVVIAFDAGGVKQRFTLEPNAVYYFTKPGQQLEFSQFVLWAAPSSTGDPATDDEQGKSDLLALDFGQALREFELEVIPAPAALAIGFTSQYAITRGQDHVGGTRGPLHCHVLVSEWSREFTETERLEVLVHELGHVLGAAHSADPDSVMRPKLVDRRARARGFRIHFDPVNTLIMYLIAEELRQGVKDFQQLSPGTKQRLRAAYATMAKTLPGDRAASQYGRLLDGPPELPQTPGKHAKPLVAATRKVVRAIVEAAEENHRLAAGPADSPGRLSGDRLTEHLFRRGAAAAGDLPPEVAAKAYLLGLGIALDDSDTLGKIPILGQLCVEVETDDERRQRRVVLGEPTMRRRRDLAKHFVVSCGLSVLISPQAAETLGIMKELSDTQGGSGFSFADLAADLAGITFATHVRDSKLSLATLSNSFGVADFHPEVANLEEGISWRSFLERYGSAEDERFHREQAVIRQQILTLPGYQGE